MYYDEDDFADPRIRASHAQCSYCCLRVPWHFMRKAVAEGVLGSSDHKGTIFGHDIKTLDGRPAEERVVRACASCMDGEPYPEGYGPEKKPPSDSIP